MEYGIIALLFLANRPEKTASVREIANSCRVPETLLSKVMQTMKNAGFVIAVHGNQGGYQLVRELGAISLLDISNSLVGPVQVAECLEPGSASCPAMESCSLIAPMQVINQKIINVFESTTLENLAPRKVSA